MARPRTFDEDAVVEAAMGAFWRGGYTETSLSDLETATDVKRISLYNAFGDKEGLFLAALDRYHVRAVGIYQDTIAVGGLDEIQGLFTSMSAPQHSTSPAHSGCLMVNTILDVRRLSELVRRKIDDYRLMLYQTFSSALENARKDGIIGCDDEELKARATYLVGLLWGALTLIRTHGATTAAAPLARVGNAAIDGWRIA